MILAKVNFKGKGASKNILANSLEEIRRDYRDIDHISSIVEQIELSPSLRRYQSRYSVIIACFVLYTIALLIIGLVIFKNL